MHDNHPFPVLAMTDPGALQRAEEILMAGRGVGIDYLSTPFFTFDSLPRMPVYLGGSHRRPARIPTDFSFWNEPVPVCPFGFDLMRSNVGGYPAASEFCGRDGHVSKIYRPGLPPLHPTKGYRRKPKGFRGGSR